MIKRLFVAVAAVFAAGALAVAGPVVAVDDNAAHSGPGSHPHHIHTADGECQDHPVDMEGGQRGLHRGSNASGPDHGMWHGTCAGHVHQ